VDIVLHDSVIMVFAQYNMLVLLYHYSFLLFSRVCLPGAQYFGQGVCIIIALGEFEASRKKNTTVEERKRIKIW
jgi:hypothetical protein